MTIGFERTNYLVKEGNVIDVCAVLTGTLKRTLEIFVNSSSGSATGIATSGIIIKLARIRIRSRTYIGIIC